MVAIIIVLLFLRTIVVRRARAAQLAFIHDGADPRTAHRGNLVVAGGDWRDGGVGGIGYGPHYQTSATITR